MTFSRYLSGFFGAVSESSKCQNANRRAFGFMDETTTNVNDVNVNANSAGALTAVNVTAGNKTVVFKVTMFTIALVCRYLYSRACDLVHTGTVASPTLFSSSLRQIQD